jgi:hypothetical protein
MPIRYAFLVAALCSLFGILPASAGTLCGTVRDATTNDPVGQAGVFLRQTTGAYTGYHAGTALDGTFCMTDVPAGTYDIGVLRDDFVVAYLRGVVVTESSVDVGVLVSHGIALATPVPNPAVSSTRLTWSLPSPGRMQLRIFDASGRFVRGWGGEAPSGTGSLVWDLRDAGGSLVSSGTYFVVLESGGARQMRSLVRVR